MSVVQGFRPTVELLESRAQPSTFLGTIANSPVLLFALQTDAGGFWQQVTPGHTREFAAAPASPHAQ